MIKRIGGVNVFLLAAGLGTRLRPLTNTIPKPCIPFLNVPMGLYHFRYLNQLTISSFIVNTFHLPKQIENLYVQQPYYKGNIQFSHEVDKIYGSGGGLKKASPLMSPKQDILMMNADEIFFTPFTDYLKKAHQYHMDHNCFSTLVVMKHPEAGRQFGAIWTNDQQVIGIGKKRPDHANEKTEAWHYIGAMFLSYEALSLIPDNIETNIFYDILIHHLNTKNVQIFPIEAEWYETGNPHDYWQATQCVLSGMNPELHDFINQYDPSLVVRNAKTNSLISKSINIDLNQLNETNIISKSAQSTPTGALSNTVLFNEHILNQSYFS